MSAPPNNKGASEGSSRRGFLFFSTFAVVVIVYQQIYAGPTITKGLREVNVDMVVTCVKDEDVAAPVKENVAEPVQELLLLPPPQEPFRCSAEQASLQSESWCRHFAGRHNMEPFWKLLRFHMPDARTFADVGANKGLVSARWLNLWRPELNITSKRYSSDVVQPYFSKQEDPKGKKEGDHPCGVTPMCNDIDPKELKLLWECAPATPDSSPNTPVHSFQIHSFEPSPPIFELHKEFGESDRASDKLRSAWNWHRLAVSNVVGEVYFNGLWNEGSSIEANSKETPNTKSVTLDSVAEEIFGDRIIDILKIDAENFDGQVVAGAARLLKEHRIRFITWESPNRFPMEIPEWSITVKNFKEFIDAMEEHAGMTCYFPGHENKMIKVTGCMDSVWEKCKSNSCPYKDCPVDFSNTACVDPNLAVSLARAMEAQALIY
jgi:FkbM family methyltransferase